MCDPGAIQSYFLSLQEALINGLTRLDPKAHQIHDQWDRPSGGGGLSHVFSKGSLLEKAGVNFSHVRGPALPPAATRARPHLANRPFEVMGVSTVLHPVNPYVPCTHMNVRFFTTAPVDGQEAVWWFGGGFDLTPAYGFAEDARDWHLAARRACQPHGPSLYPRFKAACDAYFTLPHREEPRGIGGLFFDDFDELGMAGSFALVRSVGDAFLPAWEAIAARRSGTLYGEREKAWQRYRRGRYVEFNLIHDRGTLFGLQSGGRTESILMSLPPQADWVYGMSPEPGSPEAALTRDFLVVKDWLNP